MTVKQSRNIHPDYCSVCTDETRIVKEMSRTVVCDIAFICPGLNRPVTELLLCNLLSCKEKYQVL